MLNYNNLTIPPKDFSISCGDSPGDKVLLCDGHYENANILFPKLIDEMKKIKDEKIVISVTGGSGVGKTGIAGIFAYYLQQNGIGSYVISGDNYPRRIPIHNDAERMIVLRQFALKELIAAGEYTKERFDIICALQEKEEDPNPAYIAEYPWFSHYIRGAEKGLTHYLGTPEEQCYDEFESVLRQFKAGKEEIFLRRLGRTPTELWYDAVDFSTVDVLIIEWTHGNSGFFEGVDIPILLSSTPAETREHRKARNRATDQIDSPFIVMVLDVEQKALDRSAKTAKIILSKSGAFLTYEEFLKQMEEEVSHG